MNLNLEPKLAPPGAGLPRLELLIARTLFAWQRTSGNRESFNARFQRERETIGKLVRSCDLATGAKRVLIKRPPGLEDSSRYWSVWMTLDHLRIIHQSLLRIISSLASGSVPPGKASTAAVKPSAEVTVTVIMEYEKTCDELVSTVAALPDLNTRVRFPHPWFGPLNAAGWHALAGVHLGIHRVQIERILQGLSAIKNQPALQL